MKFKLRNQLASALPLIAPYLWAIRHRMPFYDAQQTAHVLIVKAAARTYLTIFDVQFCPH